MSRQSFPATFPVSKLSQLLLPGVLACPFSHVSYGSALGIECVTVTLSDDMEKERESARPVVFGTEKSTTFCPEHM